MSGAALLAVLISVVACGGAKVAKPSFAGTPVPGTPDAPGFALADQAGRVVRLSAERGHLVLLTFLYTRCPDVCPLIAENLNTALRQVGTARESVLVLAVSVDPTGDTRPAVQAYVRQHRLLPSFRYLIGSPTQLRRVWGDYRIAVETSSLSSFSAHSAAVYLIDAAGRERVLYSAHFRPRDVIHDINELMEE